MLATISQIPSTMTQFIALLHKNGRKGYGVCFPDFPGCVSAGKMIEEALREAADALALHVDGMRQDGAKIPEPRTVEAIRDAGHDWVVFEEAIVATVPLLPSQGPPSPTAYSSAALSSS